MEIGDSWDHREREVNPVSMAELVHKVHRGRPAMMELKLVMFNRKSSEFYHDLLQGAQGETGPAGHTGFQGGPVSKVVED